MQFVELSDSNGSWGRLKEAWRAQCEAFGEDFDTFAPGAFSVLDPLASAGHDRAWVYGLEDESEILGICQINYANIPGYSGPVLRVRMFTYAPRLDLGESDGVGYADALGNMFVEVYRLSITRHPTRFIKFHLRSPFDRTFFDLFRSKMAEHPRFVSVELRGMWLYVNRA